MTCAVVTTEFENPPADGARSGSPPTSSSRPIAGAVAIAQDRLAREARSSPTAGVPTAPFAVVDDAPAPRPPIGFPAILKTARLGYDGKGQRDVADAGGVAGGVARARRGACVLEQRVHSTPR